MNNVLETIKKEAFIVIFRGIELEKIENSIKALYEGGVRVVEITFNPSDENTVEYTSSLIKKAREVMGDKMVIGAGTVVCEEYVVAAYNAGAQFIVSPDVDTDVIALTKKLGLVSMPGALTPSECKTAYKFGADIVKLFPATADKIDYIKNISRPLSHIPLFCFGGTNPDTIIPLMETGAVGVGTGITVMKKELVDNDDYAEITRLAKIHVDKVKEALEMRKNNR